MLEHVPAFLGRALRNVRAGHSELVAAKLLADGARDPAAFALTSPAFASGAPMPARFTADADGDPVSPPLAWEQSPEGTSALVLVVEDPDAPDIAPLCHSLVWGREAGPGALTEGASPPAQGRNSYQQSEWLAPDPPTGHGPHDYVFQLFAVNEVPALEKGSGRSAVVEAIEGKVVGLALLSGTYERA